MHVTACAGNEISSQNETTKNDTLFGYFWPSLFVLPLGVFCQIAMLFGLWGVLWPGFLPAVSTELFEFYWFGGRNRWLLIPVNILLVLSLLFFALFSTGALWNGMFGNSPILTVVLIAAGGLLFFASGRGKNAQF